MAGPSSPPGFFKDRRQRGWAPRRTEPAPAVCRGICFSFSKKLLPVGHTEPRPGHRLGAGWGPGLERRAEAARVHSGPIHVSVQELTQVSLKAHLALSDTAGFSGLFDPMNYRGQDHHHVSHIRNLRRWGVMRFCEHSLQSPTNPRWGENDHLLVTKLCTTMSQSSMSSF